MSGTGACPKSTGHAAAESARPIARPSRRAREGAGGNMGARDGDDSPKIRAPFSGPGGVYRGGVPRDAAGASARAALFRRRGNPPR
eukprot:scaffold258_cov354-Prasinococcus_capsulatus_cf.AAC.2